MEILEYKSNSEKNLQTNYILLILLFCSILINCFTWYYQLQFNSKVIQFMKIEEKDSKKQWNYINLLNRNNYIQEVQVDASTFWM